MYRRGLQSPKQTIALKFNWLFGSNDLPLPPVRYGHFDLVHSQWGMLANDKLGCCFFSGAAHEVMLTSAMGGRPIGMNDHCVVADYESVTGYRPYLPHSDEGTDPEAGFSYRRKTGTLDAAGKRHRLDAYCELSTGNIDYLTKASYLVGPVGIGLQLPTSAEEEFEDMVPWTDVSRPAGDGHYVPVVGRNSRGEFLIVTWGRIHAMSAAFYRKYNSISIVGLSREQLNDKGLSPDQYSDDKLVSFLSELGKVKT